MELSAVVEATGQAWRAPEFVAAVTVGIADATCVHITVLLVVLDALFAAT